MIMARRVNPICAPISPLVMWFRGEYSFVEGEESLMMEFSNTRYTTPIATIKAPPSIL